ncbi:Ras-related protein Rab-25 [Amphibalanus amphitrite]|uniref:Ras-related protein Rab-25 n=1 Tax=Amphibalanus amphitrite TaxID=1232801 RepID=A0A6A4WBW7_AMPAM|nr:ras-related protein Rab-1D-like [Amphibalanus amphitrite]XP_043201660.1 ras-related protein Rab-1D-like [Amphibalanus amphitrite]XP_043201668.1 ras-related protein Rab-1D-like [Amphibalanus amphitrite]KAF0302689.1 Ras-related protein Rab-25 [Amphibalanus amphitrite]
MATVKVPCQKVILCGEYGVGKSSLFRRFAMDTFVSASDRRSTLGLDQFEKTYTVGPDQRQIKLQLWDTGGLERVASVTSSYFKFAEAAILVFALDNIDSFNILSQHLLEIVTHAEHAKIYVCGNKTDLKHDVVVTDADIQMFCEQCHNVVTGTFKTSCKTGEGVQEMFAEISRQVAVSSRSRKELERLDDRSFRVEAPHTPDEPCSC